MRLDPPSNSDLWAPLAHVEQRSAATPQRWFPTDRFDLGDGPPAAQVRVDEGRALGIAAVWRATRLLSEALASLPAILYQRAGDDGRSRATSLPAFSVLHDAPCPEISAFGFFSTLTSHLLLWGNCYAEIERDGAGRVRALWPITPDRVVVRRHNGRLSYMVAGSPSVTLPPERMLHVAGPGFDGIMGMSVVRAARESLAACIAADRFAASFLAQGCRPSGVLTHPETLGPEALERLRTQWQERYAGSGNAGKPLILEEGMGWQALTIPAEDAQFLGTRQFSVQEVSRWFGVPPHMLGELSRATFSNIEHQGREFLTFSLLPWLKRWEGELNRKVAGSGTFVEFMTDAIVRPDQEQRSQAYERGRNGGWLSVNDIRRRENMEPIEGGDEYLRPLNMTPAGGQQGRGGQGNGRTSTGGGDGDE